MTPDNIEALCVRLRYSALDNVDCSTHCELELEAVDALRSLSATVREKAGEIERLKAVAEEAEQSRTINHAAAKMALDQRDALQARVRELEEELSAVREWLSMADSAMGTDGRTISVLRAENEALRDENGKLREIVAIAANHYARDVVRDARAAMAAEHSA